MTDAISNNRVKAPTPATDQTAKSSAQAGGNSASTQNSASAIVELSSSQMKQEIDRLPEINSGKVESIKNALANGEYQPDPEIIAQKFAEIEKLLP